MAKGKKCPSCTYYMYAQRELEEKFGTTVWYICKKCNFTEKVFETK